MRKYVINKGIESYLTSQQASITKTIQSSRFQKPTFSIIDEKISKLEKRKAQTTSSKQRQKIDQQIKSLEKQSQKISEKSKIKYEEKFKTDTKFDFKFKQDFKQKIDFKKPIISIIEKPIPPKKEKMPSFGILSFPKKIGYDDKDMKRKTKIKGKTIYTPSLIGFSIMKPTTTKPGKRFTGLEIRPVIK